MKSREGKETCNFKINACLLPILSNSSTCFIQKSTPIYHEKKIVIFELDGDHTDASSYKFDFDLGPANLQLEDEGLIQYIELSLYDISTAMEVFSTVWKYFRGHVLLKLSNQIPVFQSIEQFEAHSHTAKFTRSNFVFTNPADYLNDAKNENSSSLLILAYNELKLRKDEFARHYIKYRGNQCKNKRTKTNVD